MAIGITQIATNAYAPDGAQAINLFSLGEAQNLTLGQLVAAICIQAADAYEAQSVSRMNQMNLRVDNLEQASEILSKLANGTMSSSEWSAAKTFLNAAYGITGLPNSISAYNDRLDATRTIGATLEGQTSDTQQDMIEVQSLISQRDVSYSTSTNILRALNTSNQSTAANF